MEVCEDYGAVVDWEPRCVVESGNDESQCVFSALVWGGNCVNPS